LDVKRAAVEAGFPATYGYRLIERADIRKALEYSMECAVSPLGTTAGEILAEIYEIGKNAIEDSARIAALKYVHKHLAAVELAATPTAEVGEPGSIDATIVRVPDNKRGPKT
jgi:hypothetical protein